MEVTNPMIPIASPLRAPSIAPIWIAAAVPIPCDEAPIASPFATGLLIFISFMIGGPMILPMIPAQTTMTAVSPGIPPLLPASSIAIGVVTDFGASEAMSELFTPRR